jgi:hypothetical protein
MDGIVLGDTLDSFRQKRLLTAERRAKVELTRFGGTPFHLRRRCHRCGRVTDLMRRNSGDRWLIRSDLARLKHRM